MYSQTNREGPKVNNGSLGGHKRRGMHQSTDTIELVKNQPEPLKLWTDAQ